VHDKTAGVYVATIDAVGVGLPPPEQDFTGPVTAGMSVEVTGVTASGGFAPVIIPQRVRFLGHAPLPEPVPVTVPELQTGRYDCQRVRVRGVVHRAEFRERAIESVRLELAALGGQFVAFATNRAGINPDELIDADVELSGVALSFFNERGEMVGARVQLRGQE